MHEIWKDIPGYEGRYQVSNSGKVKSFLRSSTYPNSNGHILKPHIAKGYAYVGLRREGKSKNYLVHRLVADSFVPNPNHLNEINHKDENKGNNCADNLEWCTRSYNMAYKTARVRQGITYGKPVVQLTLDAIPIAIYCSAEYAASINNIDPSSIHKCCKHNRLTSGGYHWKYSKDIALFDTNNI